VRSRSKNAITFSNTNQGEKLFAGSSMDMSRAASVLQHFGKRQLFSRLVIAIACGCGTVRQTAADSLRTLGVLFVSFSLIACNEGVLPTTSLPVCGQVVRPGPELGSGVDASDATDSGDASGSIDTDGPSSLRAAWPSFGHDYANTRSAEERLIGPANVADLTPKWGFCGRAVTSTPAVVDENVYFSDWSGSLFARRVADGSAVWSTSLQDGMLSPSAFVSNDTVYIAGDAAMVHAVDRRSGVRRWSARVETTSNSRIWSSPVVIDTTLIIGVGSYQSFAPATPPFRGSVVALDTVSGSEKWRLWVAEEGEVGVSVWSSAALDTARKLAFIGTGQSFSRPVSPLSDSLLAIDYERGTLAWSRQFTANDTFSIDESGPDFDVGASPNLFVVGTAELVGVGDKGGRYFALDRDTGAIVWERQLTEGSAIGGVETTTAYADGNIYVVSNTGIAGSGADTMPSGCRAFAIRAADGESVWETPLSVGSLGGVAVANGVMYFTTAEGTLHALATDDGRELYRTRIGFSAAGGPSIANGLLFVGYGWDWKQGPPGGLMVYGL
jgi:polyvinyl alcohol dehydrogenase (cytochrome)